VPPRDVENASQSSQCDAKNASQASSYDRDFLVELLISRHEKRESQLQEINEMPLYPTEEIIWDENVVPGEVYNGDGVLALPKLNIQFLTLLE
jgi:intron-binding protein aquarius